MNYPFPPSFSDYYQRSSSYLSVTKGRSLLLISYAPSLFRLPRSAFVWTKISMLENRRVTSSLDRELRALSSFVSGTTSAELGFGCISTIMYFIRFLTIAPKHNWPDGSSPRAPQTVKEQTNSVDG